MKGKERSRKEKRQWKEKEEQMKGVERKEIKIDKRERRVR